MAGIAPMSSGKRAYVDQVVGFAAEHRGRPAAVLEAGVGVGVSAFAVARRLAPHDSFSAIDRDGDNIDRLRARLGVEVPCRVADLVVGDISAIRLRRCDV